MTKAFLLLLLSCSLMNATSISSSYLTTDEGYDSDQEVNQIFKYLSLKESNRNKFLHAQQLRRQRQVRKEKIKQIKQNLKKR